MRFPEKVIEALERMYNDLIIPLSITGLVIGFPLLLAESQKFMELTIVSKFLLSVIIGFPITAVIALVAAFKVNPSVLTEEKELNDVEVDRVLQFTFVISIAIGAVYTLRFLF